MVMYGIGITTFREREAENINLNAYKMFKRGKKSTASKQIARTFKKFCDELIKGEIIHIHPALGVYDGGSEPSVKILMESSANAFNKNSQNYKALNAFRKIANQDSVLVYKIVSRRHPAIVLTNVEARNVEKVREAIKLYSHGG